MTHRSESWVEAIIRRERKGVHGETCGADETEEGKIPCGAEDEEASASGTDAV